MAKPWSDVESSEAYQALSPDDKAKARDQYFTSVVAPKVPEADLGAARDQFMSFTAPKPQSWYERMRDLEDKGYAYAGHLAGVAGRGIAQDVAGLADLPTTIVAPIANSVAGQRVMEPQPFTTLANQGMNAVGVPQAQNGFERVVQAGAGSAALALTGAGLASKVAEAATSQLGKAVATMLARAPGTQTLSGLMGGTAGQIAAEAGAGPVGQTLASFAGGSLTSVPTMMRNAVKPAVPAALAAATAEDISQAQVLANATKAHEAGYVIPPAQTGDRLANNVLGGWAGKKIEQEASIKNQANTNKLVREEFGLPKDAVLDTKTFDDIRKKAGAKYEAVRNAGIPLKTDTPFRNAMQYLDGASEQLLKDYPDTKRVQEILDLRDTYTKLMPVTTGGTIDKVRLLRNEAKVNLNAQGDVVKQALGLAQRKVANELDDLMQRNLDRAAAKGLVKPDLVSDYRDARKVIAKAHDVETVTNTVAGDVSARKLATLLKKKDLSGNLEKIAEFGSAFPKSGRDAPGLGSVTASSALEAGLSLSELAYKGVGAIPAAMGMMVGRPVMRAAQLSEPYQNAVFSPRQAVPVPVQAPLATLLRSTQQGDQQ